MRTDHPPGMKQAHRFRSLRNRFLVIAVTGVTIGSVWIFFVAETLTFRSLQQSLENRMGRTAAVNAQVLATPFWNLDTRNIESAIGGLMSTPDIVAVVARGQGGEVLARTGPAGNEHPKGTLLTVRPVRYESRGVVHEVGQLELYFTDESIRRELRRRLSLDLVLFSALLLAVVISVILAVKTSLGTPLNRLLASIRQGGADKVRRPVEWSSPDELGILIQEYNDMLRRQSEAEAETVRKSALLEAALQNMGQGICVFDDGLNLSVHNDRYLELLHHSPKTVYPGLALEKIIRGNIARGEYGEVDAETFVADRLSIARSTSAGSTHRFERERPDGTVLEVSFNPMPGGGFVSTYTDITERREFEGRMHHLALHDVLTGLPNRTLFHDRLEQALAAAARRGDGVAVLFIDLDRFKDVNDTLGHDFGDKLLKEMAVRLQEATRGSDTAARLGGDEFGVIQTGLIGPERSSILAQRVIEALGKPVLLAGRTLFVTASVGVTLYPDDGVEPEALLKNADLAMYAAKAEGRNRCRYFLPRMNDQVRERRKLEEELFRAIECEELVLHYQPIIDLEAGRVVGVEALVRWLHPQRGLLAPRDFLGVAEEAGLIDRLSERVLLEACRQTRAWHQSGFPELTLSVNISPHYFGHTGMLRTVCEAPRRTELDPRFVQIEITESAIMVDPEAAVGTLRALREEGFAIAVDDFGTGYSSLGYLRRFPVDTLKIDRTFISDLPADPEAAILVRTIITLGLSLGLRVVAEGVETAEQAEFLRREHCHLAQGFYYTRPLPAEELGPWVDTWRR
ncbi:MAG: EAL domain-containing protein [Thermoanaerobaculia bacterium]|nr:EAL domain-containing protein [Thermoanaerobaculia bacterium]